MFLIFLLSLWNFQPIKGNKTTLATIVQLNGTKNNSFTEKKPEILEASATVIYEICYFL